MGRTRRQLLAVMFTDIAGYSAMVNRDERRAQALLEQHRALVQREVARREGRVIETIGDGFLITFDNARAALECAVALQHELFRRNAGAASESQLRLRIGIHAGDVEHDGRKVFGDGVNVAARLEPLAPRGGIAASAQAVAQLHGPLRACFVSQGPRELKNIAEPHEVFALAEDGIEAAARHVPAPRALRGALRRFAPALAAAGALALAGAWLLFRGGAFDASEDASIAVLPLQNLSHEPNSADFAAGLHDSLLTEIAATPQLKVISRTSVLRYADHPPPIPDIGRQLHVSYILEGTVQRNAQRIRVNVQLIRARNDEHVWAQAYDRDAGDLFDVQATIAREIAEKTLGRVLLAATPRSQRPTQSVEAYDLYLRAIGREASDPTLGRRATDPEIALLERAVLIDPNFALAHAALARYDIWGANWAGYLEPKREPQYLKAAEQAAQRAMTLAPQLPESLCARALVDYWQHADLGRTAALFESALHQRPGYPTALFWLISVYDDLGQPDKSIAAAQSLIETDPHNERVYTALAQHYVQARDYAPLAQLYARWRALTQSPAFVDFWSDQLEFYRSGNLLPWKALLAQPPGAGLVQSDVNIGRWQVAMYERRYRDAAGVVRAAADDFVKGHGDDFESALSAGQALALVPDPAQARAYLDAVVRHFEPALKKSPDQPFALATLGSAETALGLEGPALEHARRAVALTAPQPGRRPRHFHYQCLTELARSLAHFGHSQEALELLERLLSEPSDLHAHEVAVNPLWSPLDQSAEFRALIQRHLPQSSG